MTTLQEKQIDILRRQAQLEERDARNNIKLKLGQQVHYVINTAGNLTRLTATITAIEPKRELKKGFAGVVTLSNGAEKKLSEVEYLLYCMREATQAERDHFKAEAKEFDGLPESEVIKILLKRHPEAVYYDYDNQCWREIFTDDMIMKEAK